MAPDTTSLVAAHLEGHQLAFGGMSAHVAIISEIAELVCSCLAAGHKLLVCGNGGSAADLQHFAAELTGRFVTARRGLPAIALSTDTSALTSIGNDFGFERVFSRQVEALGQPGDVLVAISTSGHSPNVIEAVRAAQARNMRVAGLTGTNKGLLSRLADICFEAPGRETARVQEAHIFAIHCICAVVDQRFAAKEDQHA